MDSNVYTHIKNLSKSSVPSYLIALVLFFLIWLIQGAISFGAMMDYGGFNSRLITPIVDKVKSVGSNVAVVMFTALGFNMVAGCTLCRYVMTSAALPPWSWTKASAGPSTVSTSASRFQGW